MKLYSYTVGMWGTNSYIAASEKGHALIIDPGANPKGIQKALKDHGLTLTYIVCTHGHFDHIGAVSTLKEETGAETWLHEEDHDLWMNPALAGSGIFESFEGYIPMEPDHLYRDADTIQLDEISLRVMHTPGHTKGSSVLIAEGAIFTGDTLFAGDCGRTDLYGGNSVELKSSLERIAALEGDYQILPGHGSCSTLKAEKTQNPYLGTNYDDIF